MSRDCTKRLRVFPLTSLNLHLSHSSSCLCDADLLPLIGMPLRHLDLSEAERLTDGGLTAVLGNMPLTSLTLYNCRRVSDKGVAALRAALPALRALRLGGCELVSDVGVGALHGLPLTDIDLSGTEVEITELCLNPKIRATAKANFLRSLRVLASHQSLRRW